MAHWVAKQILGIYGTVSLDGYWDANAQTTNVPSVQKCSLRFYCRQLLVDLQNNRTGQVSLFLAKCKTMGSKYQAGNCKPYKNLAGWLFQAGPYVREAPIPENRPQCNAFHESFGGHQPLTQSFVSVFQSILVRSLQLQCPLPGKNRNDLQRLPGLK